MLRSTTLILFLVAVPATLAGEVRFAFPTTDGRSDSITLDRFLVDGRAPATAPHVRQFSPGVTEVTAESATAAEWSFAVADDSKYFGFGERFVHQTRAHSRRQHT